MIRLSWEEVAAIELYGAMCEAAGTKPDRWGDVDEAVKKDCRSFVRVVRRVFFNEQDDKS
jgi:hypothetical protein